MIVDDKPLVARGRTADVLGDGPHRVWRRYRDGRDAAAEVALMRHLAANGYPVPRIYAAEGPAMLMQRVPGPTLAGRLASRPWQLRWAAGLLRELIDRLARVPVVDGLPEPFGRGNHILHLDLHPQNVLLGAQGPVVIDWPNAARGPAAVDLAQSWLLIHSSEIPAPRAVQPAVRVFQRALAGLLLTRSDPAADWVPTLAARRLHDPNVVPSERRRLTKLAE